MPKLEDTSRSSHNMATTLQEPMADSERRDRNMEGRLQMSPP